MGKQQLKMIMSDLTGLPPVEPPPDVTIRTWRTGDEDVWARIMNTGIGDDWTPDKVRAELVTKPQFDPEGVFFALLDGDVVGSATAWRLSAEETATGKVHMVCVLPQARGKNLGYLLVLRVLRYFREHGFSSADLTTDDFRVPAIKSYLRLGFQPVMIDETHVERWRDIRSSFEKRGNDVCGISC